MDRVKQIIARHEISSESGVDTALRNGGGGRAACGALVALIGSDTRPNTEPWVAGSTPLPWPKSEPERPREPYRLGTIIVKYLV